ncbi:hypothetical protein [Rubritalea tangerina]
MSDYLTSGGGGQADSGLRHLLWRRSMLLKRGVLSFENRARGCP